MGGSWGGAFQEGVGVEEGDVAAGLSLGGFLGEGDGGAVLVEVEGGLEIIPLLGFGGGFAL